MTLSEAEQRRLQGRFKYLKHLTTLAGATAAVEVAISQTKNFNGLNERLDGKVMVVSLALLAAANAVALIRMMLLIDRNSLPNEIPEYVCSLVFFGGVFYFVL